MNVAQETLGFRRQSFSLCLSLLMSAFALPIPPAALSSHLHRPTERSPTITHLIQTSCRHASRFTVAIDLTVRGRFGLGRACRRLTCAVNRQVSLAQAFRFDMEFESGAQSAISVSSLSPVTSSAQDDSTSELLRFL